MFEGLQVANMENNLYEAGTSNGHATNGNHTNGASVDKAGKSTLNDLVEAAKAAAGTVSANMNGLKVSS